jgi:hypothetical protein
MSGPHDFPTTLNLCTRNPQLRAPEHHFAVLSSPPEIRLSPGPGPHFISEFS